MPYYLYSVEGADGSVADYEVIAPRELEARLKVQARWKKDRPHEPIVWMELEETTEK